jgi:hypothetical protein
MNRILILLSLYISSMTLSIADQKMRPMLDTTQIEKLTGIKGEFDKKSEVFKVSDPRNDLKVSAEGVTLTPALGLTSWASFTQVGGEVVVMGDLVLLENQVNPVLKKALEQGLKVTALHNHFFWDEPKIMFMHIEGMGSTEELATAVGTVFKEIKITHNKNEKRQLSEITPSKSTFDPSKIESILGKKGVLKDGVYKVVWGRTTKMHGHVMGSFMGVNTWATFAGSDQEAVMLGDFALEEGEVQEVLKILSKNKINVVAIHHHMLGENPRIIFLHYWGRGSTQELAEGLKEALNKIALNKS